MFTANGKKLGTVCGGGLSVDEYVKRLKNILKSRGNEVKGDDAEILFKGQCRRLLKEVAERRAKLPKAAKGDFKAVVTGVAVVDNRERHRYSDMKFFSPETHLTVPFGKTAVFRVEYDFPEGYAARIWTRDEWPAEQLRNSSYFGSNPSGFYRGKGVAYGFLSLLDRGESCELRSLKVITRSDPELEEAENGWIIGTTPVNLDFKDKNDGSNESVDCPQKYVSKDRLHALYRSKDGKHVFVEVCHDSDNRNFSSVRFSLDRVREAISKKVDILFLPLVLSKDGVLFSADRGELENVSNGKGLAGDYTAAQLKRMRIKHRGVLSAKHFKPFEDILRLGKGKILFKVVGSLEYQKELAVLLDKLDAWESVIFEVGDANTVKNHYDIRIREKMISGEILVTACGDRAFGVREVLPECAVSLRGLEKAEATERKRGAGRLFDTFIYAGDSDDQGAWDKALESGVTVFRSNRAADLVKYLKKKGRRSR